MTAGIHGNGQTQYGRA